MQKKAKLLIAAGEKSADMLYASGLFTPDDFIYFETENEKAVILSALEYDKGKENGHKFLHYYINSDFAAKGDIVTVAENMSKEKNISEWLVPADFPLLFADKLRSCGINVVPCEANVSFFPEREFKNADEIAQVELAMRATEKAMQCAKQMICESKVDKDGSLVYNGEFLTSEMLRSQIDMTLLKLNANALNTIAASGIQSAQPHNAGSGIIKAHTPIVIDIFPRLQSSGFFGDMTRTYVKHEAPPIVKKAFNAVVNARDEAKKYVRKGANPAEIFKVADDILKQNGFDTGRDAQGRNYGFFHSLGHGVGLEIHEAPRLSPRNQQLLQGGEIVTVEPGVYYPEWGGIRMEDIVVVEENSCRTITCMDDDFELD
ncbi:MAG: M24 family metallopeptidase [Lentisphaeria bacterium]|nr:M24 family metallopeptidase [Lentisphaeria bacterium]